jgi:hypothetical protein
LPRSKKSYEPETSVRRDQQQRYPQQHAIVEGPTTTRVFIVSPGVFTAELCASGYQKQHKNLPALSQRDQASILLPQGE